MTYHHSKKAGNQGDVWKHFVLLSVLRCLVEQEKSTCFRYLETHAGSGLYTLAQRGEWRHGIGRGVPRDENLLEHPYYRMIESPVGAGSVYPGSWVLAGRFLTSKSVAFNLELCDSSDEVADVIQATVDEDLRPFVTFHHADGFAHLEKRADRDLVLIDPPYSPRAESDWKRCAEAARQLRQSKTTFLIWYPVFWPTKPTHLAKAAGQPGFEVLWAQIGQKPSQNLKGCGMLAGGDAHQILLADQAELGSLAEHLGGKLFIREP